MKEESWHPPWPRAVPLAVSVIAASVLALSTGCGGGSGEQPGGGASHPSRRPMSTRPQTGSQLRALFPTPAQLPGGWALSTGNGQEIDSGTALARPPYLPLLPRQSCQRWKGVDPQYLLAGDQASYAQITLTVGHGRNAGLGTIDLAGYYPRWAAQQFGLISSLAHHRCGPFSKRDEITGARVRMRPAVTAVPGVGDQALLIKIVQVNGPLPDGTYYPGDYLLVVRVGNYLVDVDAPAVPGQSHASAVNQIASQLVSKLRRLR